MKKLSNYDKKQQKAKGMKKSKQPRMSVNKLGQFLVSKPKKQRSILADMKYPGDSKFKFTGYNLARKAINEYISNGFDEDILLGYISDLEKIPDEEKDKFTDSSINALTIVLESNNLSDLGYVFTPYNGNNPKLNIEGVEVSIYPDFIVESKTTKGDYYGALKIHISADGHFGEEGGKYIATLIHEFTREHIKINGKDLRNSNCISYDVFTDTIIECPNSIIRRWEEIEAGCQNIMAIWDSI